jgi:hypothetical protein
MPSGPLREVGVGGLSVYFIQTKSAIVVLGPAVCDLGLFCQSISSAALLHTNDIIKCINRFDTAWVLSSR